MKGDFTRDTFDPTNHYQQVLMQQGRAQLDADWNEQAALGEHRDETTTADIIGNCGGPADGAAFSVSADNSLGEGDFFLSAGHYYVDGILCENESKTAYLAQPDRLDVAALEKGKSYLLYLDAWQRHITAIEDPEIIESALGGPDTATRVKTVWQVRTLELSAVDASNPCGSGASDFDDLLDPGTAMLTAETVSPPTDDNPCLIPPSAGYTGLENQLYRVEIHGPGKAASATWKWSRENGSVVTPIQKIDGKKITVTSLGPDKNLGFGPGVWVEILDDALELEGKPGQLLQVDDVDQSTRVITLKSDATKLTANIDGVLAERHPKLRRWEGMGAVNGATKSPLENGVEISFDANGDYRTGHYWQIPARTATAQSASGDIEWPRELDASGQPQKDKPLPRPPRGITHHYCRLGIITVLADGTLDANAIQDCRCLWPALTAAPRLFYVSGDGQEAMPDLTVAKTYVLDDGTAENTIGGGIDGDIICLNQLTVIPGSETINSISMAWGASVHPDPSLDGLPYTVVVWSDPDGDGDPTDAKVLTTASGVIVQQGPDTFITTAITPTTITTPTFFVGFIINHSVDQFPAAIDESAPISKRSSFASGASGDISDLNNNDYPVRPTEMYGLVGNWLIRADAGGGLSRVKLPHPLIVGVPKAYRRDTVQKVRFTVEGPSAGLVVAVGNVPSQNFAEIGLDPEGLAKCDFYLDRINATQQVRAVLIDDSGCSESLPEWPSETAWCIPGRGRRGRDSSGANAPRPRLVARTLGRSFETTVTNRWRYRPCRGIRSACPRRRSRHSRRRPGGPRAPCPRRAPSSYLGRGTARCNSRPTGTCAHRGR